MLIKKYTALSLVILLLVQQLAFAQSSEKTNIAILDFDGRGISKMESGTLTDRLRTELVNTRIFTVVDRGKMETILNEIGFQQTGCTSAECAVEAGRILNVQKMISGNIGKLGQTYTIDVSLIDVQSGKIEHSYSRNYRGEIDGLLTQLKELAGEISGQEPSPHPVKKQPEKKAQESTQQTLQEENKTEESSSNTWLWITGGVLLAGGAAAALLLGSDNGGDNPAEENLPDPGSIWPPPVK